MRVLVGYAEPGMKWQVTGTGRGAMQRLLA